MKPPNKMKGSGRIAFIAHQHEITSELEAGWPIKASYLARAEALGISYQQFSRYVDALIRKRPRSPRHPEPVPSPSATLPDPAVMASPTASTERPKNERHDLKPSPGFRLAKPRRKVEEG